MDSYEALAASYDELTEDVEYEKRADFVEKLFLRAKRPVRSLLDLACGTGTMTELFARRGYTVTGVDYSPEMLAQAQQKLAAINSPPLLLCSRCHSSSCWKRSTPRSAASTASTI